MFILIFAGGSGKRFWPLGRETKPKQFLKMFNGKSTLELTWERAKKLTDPQNIFISTHENYKEQVLSLIPDLLPSNLILEPSRRDVGPAVGLAITHLLARGIKDAPTLILWADHYIHKIDSFVENIKNAVKAVKNKTAKGVLIGETPLYPATNLGWIKIGKKKRNGIYSFEGFVYRPPLEEAKQLFNTRTGLWNTAYFVSTPQYIFSFYKKYQPKMYKGLLKIKKAINTDEYNQVLKEIYPQLDEVHFDHIVFYNLPPDEVLVARTDMGWSDPGTFYALKRFYEPTEKNVIKGLGLLEDAEDSMIFNTQPDKLVVGIGLENIIIVNTKDALLVIKGTKAKKLGEVVQKLRKYKKYLPFIR